MLSKLVSKAEVLPYWHTILRLVLAGIVFAIIYLLFHKSQLSSVSSINMSLKLIAALLLNLASEYFDEVDSMITISFSLSDLLLYMMALAVYFCFENLHCYYAMCDKADS